MEEITNEGITEDITKFIEDPFSLYDKYKENKDEIDKSLNLKGGEMYEDIHEAKPNTLIRYANPRKLPNGKTVMDRVRTSHPQVLERKSSELSPEAPCPKCGSYKTVKEKKSSLGYGKRKQYVCMNCYNVFQPKYSPKEIRALYESKASELMTEEEMMNPDNWGSSSDAQKACYKQSGMPLLPNGEPDIENFDGNPRWYEELSSCDDYLSNGVNLWDHDTLEPVEYDDDISNNFGYNSQKSYYESKASEGEAPCPNCGNRTFVVPHDAYRSCNICGHSFAVKPTYDIDGNFIVQSKDWTKGNMDWEIVESKADVDLTCGMCNGTGEIYMDTLVTCHE